MKVVTTKIYRSGILLAVLVLTLCTGLLHATNEFTLTPATTLALTCSTVSGPGPAVQVTVKPAASGVTYPVTISLPSPNVSGITATLSSGSFTLTSSTSTAVLNVTALPGCQYLYYSVPGDRHDDAFPWRYRRRPGDCCGDRCRNHQCPDGQPCHCQLHC
jgi:hypothetical protein